MLFTLQEKFEIVAVLEGTIEHTGMTAQLRSSYLPSEILWGHHLAPLVTYQKENGNYKIDYAQFHKTIPISMTECSARELNEKIKAGEANRSNNNSVENKEHRTGLAVGHKEPEFPVNFTAPAFRPQKRTWSFRARGSLKGSIKRKGSNNGSGKLKNTPPPNGGSKNGSSTTATPTNNASGVVVPNGAVLQRVGVVSPIPSTSRCSSLQSVAEQDPPMSPTATTNTSKDTPTHHSTEKL